MTNNLVDLNRYFGVLEEAQFGVVNDVASPLTAYDIADGLISVDIDSPKDPNIQIPSTERFNTRHMAGYYTPGGSAQYAIDINTIGWFLKWGIGNYKYTAGTGQNPNIHEFWAARGRVPTTFTSRIGKDGFEHVMSGCGINKMNLTVDKDLANMKMDILAQKDTKKTIREHQNLNLLDEDIFPLAFYNVNTTIDGVECSSYIKKWAWDYENGLKAEDGQGQGSRFPYRWLYRDGKITLAVQMFTSDVSEQLESYWGDATGPNPNGVSDPFEVVTVFDSSAFGLMTIKFPQCYYAEVPSSFKGSDPMEPNLAVAPEAAAMKLHDTLTDIMTPVYIKLENFEPEYKLAAGSSH
jgi:hypothetical protein